MSLVYMRTPANARGVLTASPSGTVYYLSPGANIEVDSADTDWLRQHGFTAGDSPVVTDTDTNSWTADPVTTLGSTMTNSKGTLDANLQWTADAVSKAGPSISINKGTIDALVILNTETITAFDTAKFVVNKGTLSLKSE